MNLAELYEKMMGDIRLACANADKDLESGSMSDEAHAAFTLGVMVAMDSLLELMKHEQEKGQRG